MQEGLKPLPCPFCGSRAVQAADHDADGPGEPYYFCSVNACPGYTVEANFSAWNTRPASPLADENKRLKAGIKTAAHEIKAHMAMNPKIGHGRTLAAYELLQALADTVAQAEPIGEREGEGGA